MEPEIAERVEQSSRRTRPKQQHRKSLAESPLEGSGVQKKKKEKKSSSTAEWYTVRDILKERRKHGQIQYLIDWEDNPETKEHYAPTWEPHHNVGDPAILDWKNRKKERQNGLAKSVEQQPSGFATEQPSGFATEQPSGFETSQESPPVRPAKRKRASPERRPTPPTPPTPPRQPTAKKPRRAGTAETARFQSVSQENVEPQAPSTEIKDSYEEDEQLSSYGNAAQVRVEIPVRENFDRTAYAKVTVTSSQPSQPSSNSEPSQPSSNSEPSQPSSNSEPSQASVYAPSQSQLETPLPPLETPAEEQETPATQLETPATQLETPAEQLETPAPQLEIAEPQLGTSAQQRRPLYIWDEDIIPGSQELPGSSSYKPFDTPTPKTGTTAQPSTEISTDADLEAIEFNHSPLKSSQVEAAVSGFLEDKLSEPLRQPPRRRSHYLDLVCNPISSEPEPSANTTSADSQNSQQQISASSYSHVDQPLPSASWSAERDNTLASISSESGVASSDHFESSTAPGGTSSEHGSQVVTQTQPHQPSQLSIDEDSGLEFQTQVPFVSIDDSASAGPVLDVQVVESKNQSQLQDRLDSHQSLIVTDSLLQTLGSESHQGESLPPTEISVSSFEETWQAAQPSSPAPGPNQSVPSTYPAQSLQEIPRDTPETPASSDKQSEEFLTPTLGQVDAYTARSESEPREPYSLHEPRNSLNQKQFVPLLDQGTENLKASIESVSETYLSSLPSRPSPPSSSMIQFPETDGSNLPPRPSPPSDFDMEDQTRTEVPLSVTERIKRARADAAAKRALEQAASRESSAIPPVPLSHPPPLVNQLLPLRETIVEASRPVEESVPLPTTSHEVDLSSQSLRILPLGQNEHTVPLPMVSMARDVYVQTILNYKRQRKFFLGDEDVRPNLVEEIDRMIEDLKKICDHQDLIDEQSSTQINEPTYRQARWAENISTKCIFLTVFLDALRSFDEHVLVLARPGRMVDILEALFKTHEYIIRRPNLPEILNHPARGPMRITLLSTKTEDYKFVGDHPTVVIAFDSTFDIEQFPKALRVHSRYEKTLVPILFLLVTNSVEHLELCIDQKRDPIDRRIRLVNYLSQTGREVGKLGSDYPTIDVAGKAVAEFVMGGNPEGIWPLPSMPGIELDTESYENSEGIELALSGSTTQSNDISSPAPSLQPGFKRSLMVDDLIHADSPKRQRLTPVSVEGDTSIEVSVVDESAANPSMGKSEDPIAEGQILSYEQRGQAEALLKKIADLESQLRSKDAAEMELRRQNQTLEARCQDFEASISRIQPKYQEALNDRGRFEHDMKECILRETAITQRHEIRVAELTNLRDEKAIVDAELAVARITLSTSSIPDVVEMTKMTHDLHNVRGENERLQKRLGGMQNELEYMRGNYQQASSAAAEAVNELAELKEELETARRKASENAVRIHEIQRSSEIAQYLERIEELRAENAETERELEKRTEELKTLMNGRRPTRGTSVPRSPRMGTGTMSPGTRPIGRVIGNMGSRGNSPVPGEVPYRATFGEILLPAGPGSGRWGTHLQ